MFSQKTIDSIEMHFDAIRLKKHHGSSKRCALHAVDIPVTLS